jgi:hypothetical protein
LSEFNGESVPAGEDRTTPVTVVLNRWDGRADQPPLPVAQRQPPASLTSQQFRRCLRRDARSGVPSVRRATRAACASGESAWPPLRLMIGTRVLSRFVSRRGTLGVPS